MTITQQEIIAMAVEAGAIPASDGEYFPHELVICESMFETFYMAAYQRGVRDERERCVKAFEKEADSWTAWPQAGAAKRKGVAAIYARNENANSATIPPSSTTE